MEINQTQKKNVNDNKKSIYNNVHLIKTLYVLATILLVAVLIYCGVLLLDRQIVNFNNTFTEASHVIFSSLKNNKYSYNIHMFINTIVLSVGFLLGFIWNVLYSKSQFRIGKSKFLGFFSINWINLFAIMFFLVALGISPKNGSTNFNDSLFFANTRFKFYALDTNKSDISLFTNLGWGWIHSFILGFYIASIFVSVILNVFYFIWLSKPTQWKKTGSNLFEELSTRMFKENHHKNKKLDDKNINNNFSQSENKINKNKNSFEQFEIEHEQFLNQEIINPDNNKNNVETNDEFELMIKNLIKENKDAINKSQNNKNISFYDFENLVKDNNKITSNTKKYQDDNKQLKPLKELFENNKVSDINLNEFDIKNDFDLKTNPQKNNDIVKIKNLKDEYELKKQNKNNAIDSKANFAKNAFENKKQDCENKLPTIRLKKETELERLTQQKFDNVANISVKKIKESKGPLVTKVELSPSFVKHLTKQEVNENNNVVVKETSVKVINNKKNNETFIDKEIKERLKKFYE